MTALNKWERQQLEARGKDFFEQIDHKHHLTLLPDGVSEQDMTIALAYASVWWLEKERRITADEFINISGWSESKTVKTLSSVGFRARMKERGIEWPKQWRREADTFAELTPQQVMVIQVLTDPTLNKTLGARLRAAGINYAVYRNWMRNPKFKDALKNVGEQMIQDNITTVHNAVVAKAERGDVNAAKLFYEITGRHDPMRQQNIDLQRTVALLLEVITRYVTDTTTLQRVYEDFNKVLEGETPDVRGRELEAHIPEIEDAVVVNEVQVNEDGFEIVSFDLEPEPTSEPEKPNNRDPFNI